MLTVGQVANRFGVTKSKLRYALLSRHIGAQSFAGGRWRLFSEGQLPDIEAALRATGAIGERRVLAHAGESR